MWNRILRRRWSVRREALQSLMGLPTPLGPYGVSFADLQLKNTPMLRVFYPTVEQPKWYNDLFARRWLLGVGYAFGYFNKVLVPNTLFRRVMLWILAGGTYMLMWPGSALAASLSSPIYQPEDLKPDGRLPVIIFSHGLWACRTTYSAFCCDMASHGYIVVAPEHLDGSANLACYIDSNGRKNWVYHKFDDVALKDLNMEERSKQLDQRVSEVQKILDVLGDLDAGRVGQDENLVNGSAALDVRSLEGRIDINRIAVAGHSFGGATAVVAAELDKRIKSCLGLDVWWEPVKKINNDGAGNDVPVLLLNTEKFDWKALRDARLMFINRRTSGLITKLATIKGTCHQDQSDVSLLLPKLTKRIGLSGTLDAQVAKDINSRTCLQFLENHFLLSGKGFPVAGRFFTEDNEHLMWST